MIGKVIAAFKRHGAETIDTPVFELKVKNELLVFALISLNNIKRKV